MPPAQQGLGEGGRIEFVWGEYVNTSGSTGGEIDPGCDDVIFANAINTAAAAAVQVQLNTASAGKFTITTPADVDGRWIAYCLHRKA